MSDEIPPGYAPLTVETLPLRLAEALAPHLGAPEGWSVAEVGDGNLNLVFVVRGAGNAAVVKQALPWLRLVGEGWPLPLKRSFYERQALARAARHDPGRVPAVWHHDDAQALFVMPLLAPHVILRKSVVAGVAHPRLAADIGRHMARTAFGGSGLALNGASLRAEMALFAGNTVLSDITETLVFSDPYFDAPRNRHTAGLEPAIAALRADPGLRVAAQEAKHAFVTRCETLVHGDLHSGSIMVTADDTQVIDPEFAIYGPMGFDLGMFLGNLMLAYHAQAGHEVAPGGRDAYRAWLTGQMDQVWQVFAAEFRGLWRAGRPGLLYDAAVLGDGASEAALARVLAGIWRDAMRFAGVEMHRRVLGLAHVEDLEAIPPARRLPCEVRALQTGRLVATAVLQPGDLGQLAAEVEREGIS